MVCDLQDRSGITSSYDVTVGNISSSITTIDQSMEASKLQKKKLKRKAIDFNRLKVREKVFHSWLLAVVGTYDAIVQVATKHARTVVHGYWIRWKKAYVERTAEILAEAQWCLTTQRRVLRKWKHSAANEQDLRLRLRRFQAVRDSRYVKRLFMFWRSYESPTDRLATEVLEVRRDSRSPAGSRDAVQIPSNSPPGIRSPGLFRQVVEPSTELSTSKKDGSNARDFLRSTTPFDEKLKHRADALLEASFKRLRERDVTTGESTAHKAVTAVGNSVLPRDLQQFWSPPLLSPELQQHRARSQELARPKIATLHRYPDNGGMASEMANVGETRDLAKNSVLETAAEMAKNGVARAKFDTPTQPGITTGKTNCPNSSDRSSPESLMSDLLTPFEDRNFFQRLDEEIEETGVEHPAASEKNAGNAIDSTANVVSVEIISGVVNGGNTEESETTQRKWHIDTAGTVDSLVQQPETVEELPSPSLEYDPAQSSTKADAGASLSSPILLKDPWKDGLVEISPLIGASHSALLFELSKSEDTFRRQRTQFPGQDDAPEQGVTSHQHFKENLSRNERAQCAVQCGPDVIGKQSKDSNLLFSMSQSLNLTEQIHKWRKNLPKMEEISEDLGDLLAGSDASPNESTDDVKNTVTNTGKNTLLDTSNVQTAMQNACHNTMQNTYQNKGNTALSQSTVKRSERSEADGQGLVNSTLSDEQSLGVPGKSDCRSHSFDSIDGSLRMVSGQRDASEHHDPSELVSQCNSVFDSPFHTSDVIGFGNSSGSTDKGLTPLLPSDGSVKISWSGHVSHYQSETSSNRKDGRRQHVDENTTITSSRQLDAHKFHSKSLETSKNRTVRRKTKKKSGDVLKSPTAANLNTNMTNFKRKRRLQLGFRNWKQHVKERNTVLLAFALQFSLKQSKACVRKWRMVARNKKHQRSLIEEFRKDSDLMRRREVFTTWSSWTEKRLEERGKSEWFKADWRRRRKRVILARWYLHYSHQIWYADIIHQSQQNRLKTAFKIWFQNAVFRQDVRAGCEEISHRRKNDLKTRSWLSWNNVIHRRRKGERFRSTAHDMHSKRSCFTGWRQHVRIEICVYNLLMKHSEEKMLKIFELWARYVNDRQAVVQKFSWKRAVQLKKTFQVWQFFTKRVWKPSRMVVFNALARNLKQERERNQDLEIILLVDWESQYRRKLLRKFLTEWKLIWFGIMPGAEEDGEVHHDHESVRLSRDDTNHHGGSVGDGTITSRTGVEAAHQLAIKSLVKRISRRNLHKKVLLRLHFDQIKYAVQLKVEKTNTLVLKRFLARWRSRYPLKRRVMLGFFLNWTMMRIEEQRTKLIIFNWKLAVKNIVFASCETITETDRKTTKTSVLSNPSDLRQSHIIFEPFRSVVANSTSGFQGSLQNWNMGENDMPLEVDEYNVQVSSPVRREGRFDASKTTPCRIHDPQGRSHFSKAIPSVRDDKTTPVWLSRGSTASRNLRYNPGYCSMNLSCGDLAMLGRINNEIEGGRNPGENHGYRGGYQDTTLHGYQDATLQLPIRDGMMTSEVLVGPSSITSKTFNQFSNTLCDTFAVDESSLRDHLQMQKADKFHRKLLRRGAVPKVFEAWARVPFDRKKKLDEFLLEKKERAFSKRVKRLELQVKLKEFLENLRMHRKRRFLVDAWKNACVERRKNLREKLKVFRKDVVERNLKRRVLVTAWKGCFIDRWWQILETGRALQMKSATTLLQKSFARAWSDYAKRRQKKKESASKMEAAVHRIRKRNILNRIHLVVREKQKVKDNLYRAAFFQSIVLLSKCMRGFRQAVARSRRCRVADERFFQKEIALIRKAMHEWHTYHLRRRRAELVAQIVRARRRQRVLGDAFSKTWLKQFIIFGMIRHSRLRRMVYWFRLFNRQVQRMKECNAYKYQMDMRLKRKAFITIRVNNLNIRSCKKIVFSEWKQIVREQKERALVALHFAQAVSRAEALRRRGRRRLLQRCLASWNRDSEIYLAIKEGASILKKIQLRWGFDSIVNLSKYRSAEKLQTILRKISLNFGWNTWQMHLKAIVFAKKKWEVKVMTKLLCRWRDIATKARRGTEKFTTSINKACKGLFLRRLFEFCRYTRNKEDIAESYRRKVLLESSFKAIHRAYILQRRISPILRSWYRYANYRKEKRKVSVQLFFTCAREFRAKRFQSKFRKEIASRYYKRQAQRKYFLVWGACRRNVDVRVSHDCWNGFAGISDVQGTSGLQGSSPRSIVKEAKGIPKSIQSTRSSFDKSVRSSVDSQIGNVESPRRPRVVSTNRSTSSVEDASDAGSHGSCFAVLNNSISASGKVLHTPEKNIISRRSQDTSSNNITNSCRSSTNITNGTPENNSTTSENITPKKSQEEGYFAGLLDRIEKAVTENNRGDSRYSIERKCPPPIRMSRESVHTRESIDSSRGLRVSLHSLRQSANRDSISSYLSVNDFYPPASKSVFSSKSMPSKPPTQKNIEGPRYSAQEEGRTPKNDRTPINEKRLLDEHDNSIVDKELDPEDLDLDEEGFDGKELVDLKLPDFRVNAHAISQIRNPTSPGSDRYGSTGSSVLDLSITMVEGDSAIRELFENSVDGCMTRQPPIAEDILGELQEDMLGDKAGEREGRDILGDPEDEQHTLEEVFQGGLQEEGEEDLCQSLKLTTEAWDHQSPEAGITSSQEVKVRKVSARKYVANRSGERKPSNQLPRGGLGTLREHLKETYHDDMDVFFGESELLGESCLTPLEGDCHTLAHTLAFDETLDDIVDLSSSVSFNPAYARKSTTDDAKTTPSMPHSSMRNSRYRRTGNALLESSGLDDSVFAGIEIMGNVDISESNFLEEFDKEFNMKSERDSTQRSDSPNRAGSSNRSYGQGNRKDRKSQQNFRKSQEKKSPQDHESSSQIKRDRESSSQVTVDTEGCSRSREDSSGSASPKFRAERRTLDSDGSASPRMAQSVRRRKNKYHNFGKRRRFFASSSCDSILEEPELESDTSGSSNSQTSEEMIDNLPDSRSVSCSGTAPRPEESGSLLHLKERGSNVEPHRTSSNVDAHRPSSNVNRIDDPQSGASDFQQASGKPPTGLPRSRSSPGVDLSQSMDFSSGFSSRESGEKRDTEGCHQANFPSVGVNTDANLPSVAEKTKKSKKKRSSTPRPPDSSSSLPGSASTSNSLIRLDAERKKMYLGISEKSPDIPSSGAKKSEDAHVISSESPGETGPGKSPAKSGSKKELRPSSEKERTPPRKDDDSLLFPENNPGIPKWEGLYDDHDAEDLVILE